jgi:hypothetical protein
MRATPSFETFLACLRQGDDAAVRLVCQRFAARLSGVARRALDVRLLSKVDPDEVMNSALRSLCLGLRDGRFVIDDWDGLWGLVVTITLRKCGRWRDYFRAQRRDVGREQSMDGGTADDGSAHEPAATGEDPSEQLLLEETIGEMTRGLDDEQRGFVRLAIEGHAIGEISEQTGRDYHRVWRTLDLVRRRLERLRNEGEDAGGPQA